VWRISLPKRQVKTLLQLFFGVMIAGVVLLVMFPGIALWGVHAPQGINEYAHIVVFFVSITLAYMITYSALEADSPSLVMVMKIESAGSDGLPKEEFDESMNDDILVKPRVNDLLLDHMACLDGDKYKLTQKGVLFANIFIFYRKLLNVEKGG